MVIGEKMEIEKQHYLWQRRTIAIVIFLMAPLSILFGLIGADTNPAGWSTHSSTLAWKIPWTEEPGGLQSMESIRVGHD